MYALPANNYKIAVLMLRQYMEQNDTKALETFKTFKKQLYNKLSQVYSGDTLDVENLIALADIATRAGYGRLINKYWIRGICVCGETIFINAINERSYHKFPFCNWYKWIPRMPSREKAEVVRKMIQRPDDTASTLLMLYNETMTLRQLTK
jgi:hypothetical protein